MGNLEISQLLDFCFVCVFLMEALNIFFQPGNIRHNSTYKMAYGNNYLINFFCIPVLGSRHDNLGSSLAILFPNLNIVFAQVYRGLSQEHSAKHSAKKKTKHVSKLF